MAATSSDALWAALRRLSSGDARAEAEAWRTIDRYLSERFGGARHEDVRQATMISIFRGASSFTGADGKSAAAWVKTIFLRRRIDRARAEKRRALALVDDRGDERPIVAPEAVALAEDAIRSLLSEIEGAVDRVLEARHADPRARIGPRAHARARLLRSMGASVAEVRAELMADRFDAPPPSDDVVSKWIERGLPVLSAAIDEWAGEDADRAELAGRLKERVQMRRNDAGKPRAHRRKAGSGDVASVAGPGLRLRGRSRWMRSSASIAAQLPHRGGPSLGGGSRAAPFRAGLLGAGLLGAGAVVTYRRRRSRRSS